MGLLDFGENGISFGSWSGQDIWNGITDVFSGLFTGKGSLGESLTNPADWWDRFKNGETNSTNKEIAEENLEHERERNEIEDARYEDETAYNRSFSEDERAYQRAFAEDERAYQRAFAEDERAYNRALQQTLFDREDTALERQAQSLSSMGINPLSQQLNGLGAGTPLSASVPGVSSSSSVDIPGLSGRGGSALHNDFKMIDKGLLEAISPIMSLANGVSNLNTQGLQRDSLREQNDYQRLLNQEKALQNEFLRKKLEQEEEGRTQENRNITASANRNEREDIFQENYGGHDSQSTYNQIATDIAMQADRAINYTSDKVGDLSKSATKILSEAASSKIKDFSDFLKNGLENDKRRFKNFWNKWFQTPSEMEKNYMR